MKKTTKIVSPAELQQLVQTVKEMKKQTNTFEEYLFNNVWSLAHELVKSRRQKKSTFIPFLVLTQVATQVSVSDLDPMIHAWITVCKRDGTALHDFAQKVNAYAEYGEQIIVGLVKLHEGEKDEGYRKLIARLIIEACENWIADENWIFQAA